MRKESWVKAALAYCFVIFGRSGNSFFILRLAGIARGARSANSSVSKSVSLCAGYLVASWRLRVAVVA